MWNGAVSSHSNWNCSFSYHIAHLCSQQSRFISRAESRKAEAFQMPHMHWTISRRSCWVQPTVLDATKEQSERLSEYWYHLPATRRTSQFHCKKMPCLGEQEVSLPAIWPNIGSQVLLGIRPAPMARIDRSDIGNENPSCNKCQIDRVGHIEGDCIIPRGAAALIKTLFLRTLASYCRKKPPTAAHHRYISRWKQAYFLTLYWLNLYLCYTIN